MVNSERHDEKGMSQAAIGRALGLSPASMTKLKGQGMPVHSVAAAQAWREARQNVAQRKPAPEVVTPAAPAPRAPWVDPAAFGGTGPDLPGMGEDRDEARTRREIAEANKAEMEEGKMRRDLILLEAVKRQMATDFSMTREALLQLPARMAPLLAAEKDPATVQNMLHAEIHSAIETLAGAADGIERIEGAFD